MNPGPMADEHPRRAASSGIGGVRGGAIVHRSGPPRNPVIHIFELVAFECG